MTLEQKAGQLVMAPLLADADAAAFAAQAAERQVGAVLLLGNGWDSAAKVEAAAAAVDQAAPGPVRLWIAADQEGGQVQRLTGTGFETIPDGVEQGRMTPEALTAAATVWGRQLAAAGVNLNLAPVVDTVDPASRAANAPIGALDRDYGLDAAGNAEHAKAFVAGMAAGGVGAAIKHFPGLGQVTGNTDFTSKGIEDGVTGPDSESVEAFKAAIAAEPAMVMVSLATYSRIDPSAPAAFSPAVVNDLLRGRLGWRGVVVSDSLTAAAVGHVPLDQRVVAFVQAGGDLACFGSSDDAWSALDALVAKASADQAFAELVDQAAGRVLAAKTRAGLV
jgi:beta-N-acetylhexosaminidase